MLWFVIAGILILWSIAYHLSGTGTGGSSIGAWFRKWSIRRMTWTKRVGGAGKETGKNQEEGRDAQATRKRVVWASPTFAQTITVLVLIGSALCLTFIGDDYIAVSLPILLEETSAERRFLFSSRNSQRRVHSEDIAAINLTLEVQGLPRLLSERNELSLLYNTRPLPPTSTKPPRCLYQLDSATKSSLVRSNEDL